MSDVVDKAIAWDMNAKKNAEIKRLREALEPFARYADNFDNHEYGDPSRPLLHKDDDHPLDRYGPTIGELRQARAALSHPDGTITSGERTEKS